jgi:hypothetical protein
MRVRVTDEEIKVQVSLFLLGGLGILHFGERRSGYTESMDRALSSLLVPPVLISLHGVHTSQVIF